MRKQSPLCR